MTNRAQTFKRGTFFCEKQDIIFLAVHIFSLYTDKKKFKKILIYKEIQSGAIAKSYMRKGFLIYEEMRKYFPIYEDAVSRI